MTLRDMVNESPYSQVVLADMIGCSRSTIQRTIKDPERYPDIVESIKHYISIGVDRSNPKEKVNKENGFKEEIEIVSISHKGTDFFKFLTIDQFIKIEKALIKEREGSYGL